MDREKLRGDYNEAFDQMIELANPESARPNFFVVHPDYLSPTISNEKLPLGDPRGEYEYFRGIKETLERALLKGKIPCPNFSHLPPYVEELVEKD